MRKDKTIQCKQCSSEMRKKGKAKHSQGLAAILLISGLIFLFAIPPIGVILLLIALWMGSGYKYYWVCGNCGYSFDINK